MKKSGQTLSKKEHGSVYYMKRLLNMLLIMLLCAAVINGCAAAPASASSSAPATASPSAQAPAYDENSDETASASPSKDQSAPNEIRHEGSVYYLDEKDAAVADYNEEPPLRSKKEDGSDDKSLGIRGFRFDIIGGYIFVDSMVPDFADSGTRTWITTRMNLDGTDKKELEFGSMSPRLIPEGGQKFYFTVAGESAVYISDLPCENVDTVIVNLPDLSAIQKRVGSNADMQLDISSVSGSQISFNAAFSSKDGSDLYFGKYNISADGKTIKKVSGEFVNNNASENEVD